MLKAQGEVARFEEVLPEYLAAPEITRKRIYLETMQEVLSNSRKVIIDTPKGQTPMLYMPLPQEMMQNTPSPKEEKEQVTVNVSPEESSSSTVNTNTEGSAYPPLNTSGYPNVRRDR